MTTVVMSTTESGAIINYSNSPSMLEDLLFLVRLLDREIDRIIASGDANLN